MLGDRAFCAYFTIALLQERQVDVVVRLHQRRRADFRRGRRLGPKDHQVEWSKPPRPEWLDHDTYRRLPEALVLLASVAMLVWLLAMVYHTNQIVLGLALAAIVGAGLSNVPDRLRAGGITDILYIGSLSLNIADIGILVGVSGILCSVLASACCRPATTGSHQKA